MRIPDGVHSSMAYGTDVRSLFRYAFQRVADPSAAKQIWKSNDTPTVGKWIENIEQKYAEQMEDQKNRWPAEVN